jgi:hypothetical protein
MTSSVPQFLHFIGVLFVEQKTHPSFYYIQTRIDFSHTYKFLENTEATAAAMRGTFRTLKPS